MRSDLVLHEWVACRDSWSGIEAAIRSLDAQVPHPQGWTRGPGCLVLRVRPGRVLILAKDVHSAQPRAKSMPEGEGFITIDQTGGHAAFVAHGEGHGEAPGQERAAAWSSLCRVEAWDRPGKVVSTLIAQVPVILVALPDRVLLLGPSSYGQHLGEALERAGIRCEPATRFDDTGW